MDYLILLAVSDYIYLLSYFFISYLLAARYVDSWVDRVVLLMLSSLIDYSSYDFSRCSCYRMISQWVWAYALLVRSYRFIR